MNAMKKLLLLALTALLAFPGAFAQEDAGADEKNISFGILVMGGARYDNVRMCAGSPAGVKGGPIGDIMFTMKYRFSDKYAAVLNIPVMRPILFAASHDMLQFEPEAVFEMHRSLNGKRDFIHGPGLGLSANYGPDYNSGTENPTESFYAFGPIVNYQVGLAFNGKSQQHVIALKSFYTPLFSSDGHDNGHVVGGTLQYSIYF